MGPVCLLLPSRTPCRVLMWAVAITVVNVAWALVVDGEAVRELNDADHPFQDSVPIPVQELGAEGPFRPCLRPSSNMADNR